MDFHNKLKELRKGKNITQDELASKLYVSRTAVSKWESGKGYPSIETLKAIASFYSISIDELLSNDELVDYSINSVRNEKNRLLAFFYGLLDFSGLLMMLIPLFGQAIGNDYYSVSLINLNASLFVHILYYLLIILLGVIGIITLLLLFFGRYYKNIMHISLIVSLLMISIFMITKQPYAGTYALVIGVIKLLIYFKNKE